MIAVLVFGAAPASAFLVRLANGKEISYEALAGSKAPAYARAFDAFFSNLDYGGGPVMPSSTNSTVVWDPSNYTGTAFQGGYASGVNKFLQDVAADAGKATNSYSVTTQYNDAAGNTAAYAAHFGTSYTDTDPLPSNGCSSGAICLTDAQLQSELDSFLGSQGATRDLTREYFLLTPPDVVTCFDSTGTQCSANATTGQAFCAYHSATSFLYANIPDMSGINGCDPFATFCPNVACSYDNGPADGVLSAVSHETIESNTDPQPNNAWTDWQSCGAGAPMTCGGEIGDKCNDDAFSDPNVQLQDNGLGTDTPYNETINGTHYLIQREWSNQTTQCLDSFTSNGKTATASFTQSAGAGTTVNFNAGASTATGGVAEYVWQFNDGPQQQTTTIEATSPTISHTFAATGTYDVALTAMGSDGTSNGTAHNVTVGADEAPTASFTAPTGGVDGSPVSFSGSGSDPDGTIVSYAWTFGDTGTSTQQNPSHTYTAPGTYTVTLTVTDSDNQTGSVSHSVTISDESPTASFTAPTGGVAGSPVSFSGSGSDPDGTIVSYAWAFGDGGTSTQQNPSHTYAAGGTYPVTLTVTDSDGQTGHVTHQVFVAQDESPTAAFSFSPASALEGSSISFDASGSSDPDGTIQTYTWSFGDSSFGTGLTVSHPFATAGSYLVTLTVTDSSGQSATTTHTVTITDEAATASFTPPGGLAGAAVSFSGSGTDPDGSVSFAWNFGDGQTGAGANPSHRYARAGRYTVVLTVRDSSGQSVTATGQVNIAPSCQVPNVKGKSRAAARRALHGAGCAVGKVIAPHKPRHAKLVVKKESPAAGSVEPVGTKVKLTLG